MSNQGETEMDTDETGAKSLECCPMDQGGGDNCPKRKVPILNEKRFHAFLTYSENDSQVAMKLYEDLTEAGFSISFAPINFSPGKPVIDNIKTNIKDSRRVIHLYSEHFQNSPWCKAEMHFTHDQQFEDKVWKSFYILYNMSYDDVSDHMKTVMGHKQWKCYSDDDFWEFLCENLAADNVRLIDELPCGNIAQGLAWNYFYGYLDLIFHFTEEYITKSSWNKEGTFFKKMFILIPESCHCPNTFEEVDSQIEQVGKLPTIKTTRAGVLDRSFTFDVFQINLEQGKKYYFIGQFSPQVKTLKQMLDGRITGWNKYEMEKQTTIFYHTLRHILSHPRAPHCHNKARIHMYNDTEIPSLAEELVKIIKEETDEQSCGTKRKAITP